MADSWSAIALFAVWGDCCSESIESCLEFETLSSDSDVVRSSA